jgi:hypothetical protein
MQNLWSDADAKAAIARHAGKGIGEDLALRVYTTRLLGGAPKLVLHGGGNTSVKTRVADVTGQSRSLRKGSGWDMGTIRRPVTGRASGARHLLGLQALPARTWSTSALQSSRQQGAQPVGRDPAAPSCAPFIDHPVSTPCWR